MRNYFLLLLLIAFLGSCGDDPAKTMTVSGNIKGLKKGMLYLQHVSDSVLVTKDSLEIDGDGNFSLSTPIESPEIFYLYLSKNDNNEVNDRITFFGEPGIITINTKWDRFDQGAKIEGSESNMTLEEFKTSLSQMNIRNMKLMQQAGNTEIPLDSLQLDSLRKKSDRNIQLTYAFALNFALNHKDSHVAPYIALFEVADANPKYLDSISKSLTPEIADSKYGKLLRERLKK
ncbi:DUF4369 domain-containing protein [Aggregatimonas sangjinii]|uniref:DUF4369 domain-containing protein n=1 Tax=Aggregatimonas sangjinii TaxID=2583587 RepID=A0A5B7SQN1_9FLAO|nr:DUF4369 domain-containing protein [Aggregatimonas sangjinii]QCW99249.1 DUF4369 domain-containing protein [Aggregatimonas sangjinii]